jgi:uncharacterized membrane protein YqhA
VSRTRGRTHVRTRLRTVPNPKILLALWRASTHVTVMQATDAFLFGLVLIVFTYAITFGFAFRVPSSVRTKAPLWMRVEGLGEIKITLIEVVLVYLVVDFVTDVVEAETRFTWEMVAKPTAIVLIAGALRLLGTAHLNDQPDTSEKPPRTSETVEHLAEK